MPISPIPRNLLPHSGTYKRLTGLDARGKKTFASDVSVSYVRHEKAKQNALTAFGEQKNDLLLLFYDCMNSYPAGIVPVPGDVFVFDGQEYTVRSSTPEYTVYGMPHHYEVNLV